MSYIRNNEKFVCILNSECVSKNDIRGKDWKVWTGGFSERYRGKERMSERTRIIYNCSSSQMSLKLSRIWSSKC